MHGRCSSQYRERAPKRARERDACNRVNMAPIMSKPTRSCTSFGVEQAALILNGFVVPKSTLEDIPGDTEMLFGLTDAIEEELLAATDTAPAPKSHGTGRESVFSATLKERAVRLAFAIYKRNGDKWKKGWPTKVEADTGVPRQTVVRWIGGHTSVDSCVAAVLASAQGPRHRHASRYRGGSLRTHYQMLEAVHDANQGVYYGAVVPLVSCGGR
jgi:hypothetical protein